MLEDLHSRLVERTQAFLVACEHDQVPDRHLRLDLRLAARLRPEADEADLALRQACDELARHAGESLMRLEGWTSEEPLAQACTQLRQCLAAVTLAMEQPRRAATIWTVTLMPRDAQGRPQATLARTFAWCTSRAIAEQWLHSHDTFEYYYCFAVIEQVRPAPFSTVLSTVRWYRARWDLVAGAGGDPPVEAIEPPPGFEGCGAFGL